MDSKNLNGKNKRRIICAKLILKITLVSSIIAAALNGSYAISGYLYEHLVVNDATYIIFGIVYDCFRGFLIGLGVSISLVFMAKFWKAFSRSF